MKWSSKAASIFFLLFSIGASAKITPMSVVFGPNPSREEKIINTALSTIDFYDGGDGNFYANGRLISFTMEAQLFPNSIQMSMND